MRTELQSLVDIRTDMEDNKHLYDNSAVSPPENQVKPIKSIYNKGQSSNFLDQELRFYMESLTSKAV